MQRASTRGSPWVSWRGRAADFSGRTTVVRVEPERDPSVGAPRFAPKRHNARVSSSSPNRVETATAALEQEQTANGLLRRTADELVSLFDARACIISRVIGDLLLEVTQSSAGALIPTAGNGYLLPGDPLTQE